MNHANRTANGALASAAEIASMKGNYPHPTPPVTPSATPCIEAKSWAEVAALVAQYHTDKDNQCISSSISLGSSEATSSDASMQHTCHDKDKSEMQFPNEVEAGALDYAGKQAAAYIESIAKTDLASFSAQDWQTMIGTACNGYVDYIVRTRAMAIDAASKIITDKDIPY